MIEVEPADVEANGAAAEPTATMSADHSRRRRFEDMFDANFRSLLGYAARRTANSGDAADVVAETFLVAWRRLDDVPNSPEDRLWLYGTARRVLANQRRSERRRNNLVDKIGSQLDTVMPEISDTALMIGEALRRLEPDDAELLRLTAWEGLSPAEIALVWGMPAATVRTRLHRARSRLRRELEMKRTGDTGHVEDSGHPSARDPEEMP